jgi:nucleoside-diphosphate-sugar epimerase
VAGDGSLSGKPVLVTGASGFIGSHLTRRLVAEGAKVHALTSTVSSIYPARLLEIRDSIALHEASLDDRGAIELLADEVRPEYVFHLGAYTHVGKSWNRVDECIQVNIQGTVNLLMAMQRHGFTRFLNTGTSEIYGDIDVPFREDASVHPISPYSISKHTAEEYCRLFGDSRSLPIVRVRPFNAYGPMQTPDRVIPEIISRAVQGQSLKMTQATQTREFNYVEDLADGFVALATANGIDGDVFNLGCGREISMRDIAVTILSLMGDPITPEFGALPERPIEIYRMHADVTKTRERVGWTSKISLEEGLERTIAWYRGALASGNSPFAS